MTESVKAERHPAGDRTSLKGRKAPRKAHEESVFRNDLGGSQAHARGAVPDTGFILVKGVPHITWTFLSKEPEALGAEGGIFSVIVGTLAVSTRGAHIDTDRSSGGSIFQRVLERRQDNKIIRFFTEVLRGIPSIIFGLFGFAFFVVYMQMGWSVIAGALTLTLMILPTIVRTTEEALKTVPMSYPRRKPVAWSDKVVHDKKVVLPCCKGRHTDRSDPRRGKSYRRDSGAHADDRRVAQHTDIAVQLDKNYSAASVHARV